MVLLCGHSVDYPPHEFLSIVGSGASDASVFGLAIAAARMVFDTAQELGMPECTLLDLGGGFYGGFDEKSGEPYIRTSSAQGGVCPSEVFDSYPVLSSQLPMILYL